jgi:hypothetical protein
MILKTLQAKHWQVFLILFGIPLGIHLLVLNYVFRGGARFNRQLLDQYLVYRPLVLFLMLFFMGVWFWSVGVGLQKIIPLELQLKVKRFKVFFFIPLVYILFSMGFLENIMYSIFSNEQSGFLLSWFSSILLIHSFSIFCILYCVYFIAKTIVIAKLQRAVKFNDCVGIILLLWLLPIGIWFIQPLINKLIATYDVNPEDQKSSFLLLDDELF